MDFVPLKEIAKVAAFFLATLALALAVAFPVSHAVTSKFVGGLNEMNQREQAECEAKGGTYTPKSFLAYGTQCVSEEGYYMDLESYSKAD